MTNVDVDYFTVRSPQVHMASTFRRDILAPFQGRNKFCAGTAISHSYSDKMAVTQSQGSEKINPVWSNRKVSTAKVKLVWATSGEMIETLPFKSHYGREARTA